MEEVLDQQILRTDSSCSTTEQQFTLFSKQTHKLNSRRKGHVKSTQLKILFFSLALSWIFWGKKNKSKTMLTAKLQNPVLPNILNYYLAL